jgi:hypothetical protein
MVESEEEPPEAIEENPKVLWHLSVNVDINRSP